MVWNSPLLTSLIVIACTNGFGFITTALTQTHKITDLVGTGSFLVSIWITGTTDPDGLKFTTRQIVLLCLVTVWSARLALFLFYRVLAIGSDSRFDKFFLQNGETWCTGPKFFPFGLSVFWFLQFLWGVLVLFPATLSIRKTDNLYWNTDILFLCTSIFGFVWEATADIQKTLHKQKSDGFCRTGVWAYSRHPNYFGDLVFWWSIYFFCLPTFSGWEHVAVVGPVFISVLLLFVSGVPIAEENSKKKYGNLEDFKVYHENTSLLIPWIPAKISYSFSSTS